MRYWHIREVSDRLRNDRIERKEARNRELPDCIGFHDPRDEQDD